MTKYWLRPALFVSTLSIALILRGGSLLNRAQTQTDAPVASTDWRNIKTGSVIPGEGYSDQPYVVITDDGALLCVMTTGKGVEGEGGQLSFAKTS